MTITTKLFGEIEVDENKMITFTSGIIGFPDLTDFLLIHESETAGGIRWMQSIQEPAFAIPVIDPLVVMENYNPNVEDEFIKPLNIKDEDDMLVLVTITVPSDIKEMTVNLRAPIIICGSSRKANQIIVEQDEYLVKFPIYEILKTAKEKAGE